MTKKQRVTMWRRMSQCFDRHERTMIEQQKKKSRMDIIGQNGNTGEHYFCADKGNRGNWWGLADDWEDEPVEKIEKKDTYKGANYTGRNREPDATGAEEDLPSSAEDRAKVRGNYEI